MAVIRVNKASNLKKTGFKLRSQHREGVVFANVSVDGKPSYKLVCSQIELHFETDTKVSKVETAYVYGEVFAINTRGEAEKYIVKSANYVNDKPSWVQYFYADLDFKTGERLTKDLAVKLQQQAGAHGYKISSAEIWDNFDKGQRSGRDEYAYGMNVSKETDFVRCIDKDWLLKAVKSVNLEFEGK